MEAAVYLGKALASQGEYAEATALHRSIHRLQIRMFGLQSLVTLAAATILANTLSASGDHEQAEAMYRSTLRHLQEAHSVDEVEVKLNLGAERPTILEAARGLARALTNQRKYAEAAGVYKATVAVMQKAKGKGHPETLIHSLELGNALASLREHAQAAAIFKTILPLMQRVLGPEHKKTIDAERNLKRMVAEGVAAGIQSIGGGGGGGGTTPICRGGKGPNR